MAKYTTPKTAMPTPLPPMPIGGDRASWIRFAIQIALLLAGLYLNGGAATKVEEVKKDVQEVKTSQSQMQMKLDVK